jgi:hypothetical protein
MPPIQFSALAGAIIFDRPPVRTDLVSRDEGDFDRLHDPLWSVIQRDGLVPERRLYPGMGWVPTSVGFSKWWTASAVRQVTSPAGPMSVFATRSPSPLSSGSQTMQSFCRGEPQSRLRRVGGPIESLTLDLWLLTHPDLRSSARVKAVVAYLADFVVKRRALFEGSD